MESVTDLMASYRSWASAFADVVLQQTSGGFKEQRPREIEVDDAGFASPRTDVFKRMLSARVLGLVTALAATILVVVVLVFWDNGDPRIVAELTDAGQHMSLDKDGELSGLETYSAEARALAKGILSTGSLDTPAVFEELGNSRGSFERDVNELISPVGTVVMSDRPVFVWRVQPGAESYDIVIWEEESGPKDFVKKADNLLQNQWQCEKPLERGKVYLWKVSATIGGERHVPPEGRAKFKVLEAKKLRGIEDAKERLGESHLLMLAVYVREGLVEQAEHELKLLSQNNPGSSLVDSLSKSLEELLQFNP
jgi:hypothetical protein